MFEKCGGGCEQCTVVHKTPFHQLEGSMLERASDTGRTLTFARGESIFHFDDDAHHFFCVQSGRVQLFRSNPQREQSFAIVGASQWVGFRDALLRAPYRHSARCLTETTVCKFHRSLIDELMRGSAGFAAEMARLMADEWAQSEHQSYNLGSRRVMERLADFLIGSTDTPMSVRETEVELPVTRETLATLLGTTTESVIRALSDLQARGWIKLNRRHVSLLRLEELQRLVVES